MVNMIQPLQLVMLQLLTLNVNATQGLCGHNLCKSQKLWFGIQKLNVILLIILINKNQFHKPFTQSP